jgi:hypothetical protein
MQSRQCPKCSGSMAEGFVVDASHGTMGVSSWIEGPPKKSVWTGVSLTGRRRSEIATWRCGRCGFLEHYAVGEPDAKPADAEAKKVLLAVFAAVLAVVLAVLAALVLARWHR